MVQRPGLALDLGFHRREPSPEVHEAVLGEVLFPGLQTRDVVQLAEVLHQVVEQDVDHRLERNDRRVEQKVKDEVFLLDTPLDRDAGLFVELPNQQNRYGLG